MFFIAVFIYIFVLYLAWWPNTENKSCSLFPCSHDFCGCIWTIKTAQDLLILYKRGRKKLADPSNSGINHFIPELFWVVVSFLFLCHHYLRDLQSIKPIRICLNDDCLFPTLSTLIQISGRRILTTAFSWKQPRNWNIHLTHL